MIIRFAICGSNFEMPPKKKKAETVDDNQLPTSGSCDYAADSLPMIKAFQDMLDNRLKVQEEKLTAQMKGFFEDDILKYHKKTQEELQSIQDSQQFISAKFDEVLTSINSLKEENAQLKVENVNLKLEVNAMSQKIIKLEEGQEELKSYSRRDCLEFHGIPETPSENTDEIVKQICNLIDVDITEADVSVSHRLPTRRGTVKSIIAKFTRRNIRDKIYRQRSRLRNYTSSDIVLSHTSNKLYINESLTPSAKELFYKVREFCKMYKFKYVWTRYGKCYLKKNDQEHDTALSFTSLKEFEKFSTQFSATLLSQS